MPPFPACRMAVPEAAMNEYCEAFLGQVEVRLARELLRMVPESGSQGPQMTGEIALGGSILSAYRLHDLASLGLGEYVGHYCRCAGGTELKPRAERRKLAGTSEA